MAKRPIMSKCDDIKCNTIQNAFRISFYLHIEGNSVQLINYLPPSLFIHIYYTFEY